MVVERKRQIRAAVLRARQAQSAALHAERSHHVQERFLAIEDYQAGARIALYAPVRQEVLTDLIFTRAVQQGKRVAFPRVSSSAAALEFVPVERWTDLEPGSFGIPEPSHDPEREWDPRSIDIMAVPGVAFDASGHRLGYGGGYYDRLLSDPENRPPCVVGLAFDFQVVDELPIDQHDAQVDWVVTETRVIPRDRAGIAPSEIGAPGA